ncbi:MAG: RidA family protein [Chloroflexi bacterium]|jgi:2-iminobutanoate/2-iminopropanoate deaminase|nr:RidA family protein [Anaerolineaceae bacterium]NLI45404.1 RidA family protein [Chloroflexota bacterium]HOE35144.1 RidA family protein [Anaerolineaceae bacterium]HOT26341.1 RidA family protein [Anaerolineaceae bacterium]HQH58384.1 RidA family protein [Anaerolineaceae bacterium]
MNSRQTPKQVVVTDRAPKAIGPYSAAIACQGFVFVSGQLGIDPESGNLLEGVEAQARQALRNLRAVLEAAHTDLSAVVKTTVFLKDMTDFAAVNAVYAEFFTQDYPARSAVQVAALPKGGLVEIDAIAAASVE